MDLAQNLQIGLRVMLKGQCSCDRWKRLGPNLHLTSGIHKKRAIDRPKILDLFWVMGLDLIVAPRRRHLGSWFAPLLGSRGLKHMCRKWQSPVCSVQKGVSSSCQDRRKTLSSNKRSPLPSMWILLDLQIGQEIGQSWESGTGERICCARKGRFTQKKWFEPVMLEHVEQTQIQFSHKTCGNYVSYCCRCELSAELSHMSFLPVLGFATTHQKVRNLEDKTHTDNTFTLCTLGEEKVNHSHFQEEVSPHCGQS